MAHNKLYRNFIILQEDERGYSHSNDKALSGYAKVEAKGDKCKVSFYAQNLKQEDNYSMVLICCKRDLKQLINLGPLVINGVGKGDAGKEYYVNNIAGLGISYEKISGAAICKVKDNETDFIMHGFINGEDSTDNWRKFKVVKVDSKKYINKLDEESKRKDVLSSSIEDKAILSQSNTAETKLVETSKLESELVEYKRDESNLKSKEGIKTEDLNGNNLKVEDKDESRIKDENNLQSKESIKAGALNEDDLKVENKDENNLQFKENIEVGTLNKHNSKVEDKDENRIKDENNLQSKESIEVGTLNEENLNVEDKYESRVLEKNEEIVKIITVLDEERNNHEESKKCSKCGKNENAEENRKCGKCENIEEAINKLAKRLENYDGAIDLRINNLHEDIIVYGFISDKKGNDCKWKKFKLEKKFRNENQDFTNIQVNSRRMEENFELDKLNQTDERNRIDRLDIIDFDEYENDIEKAGVNNIEQQPSADNINKQQLSVENIEQQPSADNINKQQLSVENIEQQPSVENIKQQPSVENIKQQPSVENIKQQPTLNECFKVNGEVGQYFEKLAEGFETYKGSLADINYCKLYKINVNSIEDLCDESNYNKYTLAYYPMLNYYPYISKIGYFLLGYKCSRNGEIKYIVYGIPGSKEKEDQPYGGRTGFVTWTIDNKNDRGYWLMFYDFKNSSIVIPTK